MSLLLASGRPSTARRLSYINNDSSNNQIQWPPSMIVQQENMLGMGRRRALDLYGTKDIVFSHEQIKKAKRSNESSSGILLSRDSTCRL
ncbi:hypothetical protein I4U23_008976 [Adineta vaga]|nr:hypothetical protein I4U23_008976 [Adineta vaga]